MNKSSAVTIEPVPGCNFCASVAPGTHWTCVECGFNGHAGLGYWACHVDADMTPVCRGACFRAYDDRKRQDRAEEELLDALRRWGRIS